MSLAERLHLYRDPDRPRVPMGGSRSEALALMLALAIVATLVASFWYQALR